MLQETPTLRPCFSVSAAIPRMYSAAAGGHYIFDWTTLANGPHTIGWLITDDCNRADGVGSRFFTVSGGTGLTSADTPFVVAAPLGLMAAMRFHSDGRALVYDGLPGPSPARAIRRV